MKTSAKTGFALCAAVALIAAAAAPAALAKGSVATASDSAQLSSSQTQTVTSKCPGGMHLTGGGYAVSPVYNPAGSVGTKTLVQVSRPDHTKAWVSTAGAVQVPISTGSFTTYARCERNSLGTLSTKAVKQVTVAPTGAQGMVFNCPGNSHALFGGFATDRPFTATDLGSSQLFAAESARTGKRQWTVVGFNASPTVSTDMTGYAYCELNRGTGKVSSASKTVPIVNDARVTASPSCPKHAHAVSGGFTVNPLPVTGGTVPSFGIDENLPAGKGWLIGLYENPGFTLPAGSNLVAQVNCKS